MNKHVETIALCRLIIKLLFNDVYYIYYNKNYVAKINNILKILIF